MIEAGDAAAATPVLRRAVDRMTRALMYLDDSSGIVGDDLKKIMGLYARACAAVPPATSTTRVSTSRYATCVNSSPSCPAMLIATWPSWPAT